MRTSIDSPSQVLCRGYHGRSLGWLVVRRSVLRGGDDRFQERITDALRADGRVLGNCHVNDPSLVRVERAHLLRAVAARPIGHEARHLPELGVLLPPVAVTVDHDAIVVAELLAKR